MALKGRLESEDVVIPQPASIVMPNNGEVTLPETTVVTADGPIDSEYAKAIAFAEEIVEVTLAESTDPNAEPYVEVWVNGVHQGFWRGRPVQCKRKYLEVLARSQPTSISTTEIMNSMGEREVRIDKRTATKYPFSVVDRNPNGSAWLRSVMQAA
jgi:hypothetical protein